MHGTRLLRVAGTSGGAGRRVPVQSGSGRPASDLATLSAASLCGELPDGHVHPPGLWGGQMGGQSADRVLARPPRSPRPDGRRPASDRGRGCRQHADLDLRGLSGVAGAGRGGLGHVRDRGHDDHGGPAGCSAPRPVGQPAPDERNAGAAAGQLGRGVGVPGHRAWGSVRGGGGLYADRGDRGGTASPPTTAASWARCSGRLGWS
jgi:hypothetical protein